MYSHNEDGGEEDLGRVSTHGALHFSRLGEAVLNGDAWADRRVGPCSPCSNGGVSIVTIMLDRLCLYVIEITTLKSRITISTVL